MTEQEFNAWAKFQATNAGHWCVDPIHNGTGGQDLLVYVAQPGDATQGIYVSIHKVPLKPVQGVDGANAKQWTLESGRFTDAVPHMGEAHYTIKHRLPVEDLSDGVRVACERLGLSFLLALTHGVSPCRAV